MEAIRVCKFLIFDRKSLFQPQVVALEGNTMDIEDVKKKQEWVEQGNLLDIQGQYEKAIAAYDNALKIDPEDADAIFVKGQTLVKLGRVPEAMKHFETATQMHVGTYG
jgi:tetratricopeptide (TPR) repeat protein